MTFDYVPADCQACHVAGNTCLEDIRQRPTRGRDTKFQIKQNRLCDCVFEQFVPGSDSDAAPTRLFSEYTNQMKLKARSAGRLIWGDEFALEKAALGKVHGDIYEILEAASLWNATAAWNSFMDSGIWNATAYTRPHNAVAAKSRKVAVIKLPRNFNATILFKDEVRAEICAFEQALRLQGMELGLSSPDIVGVRLPHPLPPECAIFMQPLPNLSRGNRELLTSAHEKLIGKLDARSFLFAIAVKTSTRSDRLYQPLFEAMVLKFLVCFVLRGASFKFHAHLETFDGADVESRYEAADLTSILLGGQFRKAIDTLYKSLRPADTAQEIINGYPSFPI